MLVEAAGGGGLSDPQVQGAATYCLPTPTRGPLGHEALVGRVLGVLINGSLSLEFPHHT